ncbi:protein NUCLEAR FUSION DEFECTIVE 4 [Senna tora]|uniref:Protein NUCLEAR FUSION DEFECTIVE 4 n=1 Tax=Senna tora TaxID=362788 RepID=A0A834WWK3_9FABA|nr:protein NUCLEAR FUSION DEFECTIVE 4 [Senna tora]
MPSRALQWLSLVGIIWLQAINGTNTNFPAYSSQLKHLLSISQLQLNNLAFASDAGKLFGWFSGIAAQYLPLWLVLLIGSSLGLIGYGVQYLFLTNQISSLSYWQVFLLTVLAGNSICWINTVCYVVSIRNFPYDRQVAVGLSTSYQGLSAKIYTNIVEASSNNINNAKTYLLLNSILPLMACLMAIPIVREIEGVNYTNMGVGFVLMFVITIGTGIYAVMSSLGFVSHKLSSLSILVGIVVCLLLPLIVPFVEKMKELVGVTIGLVYLNNLGQIAESRGSATSSLVVLSSSFGFFGRLMPSLMDYFYRGKSVISRPGCMVALIAPTAGAFFLLLNKTETALYISTGIIGVCSGAITSICVSTTSELFGTKNFSVNHNVVVANIPIGSFLFGFSSAILYHKEADHHTGKCMGMQCYQTTFIIWAALSLFATFLAFILYARTRKFYSPPT